MNRANDPGGVRSEPRPSVRQITHTMSPICAWCQKPLPPVEAFLDRPSFPGMCPDCARRSQGERPVALADLLNEFAVPVLAVDDDVVVLAANDAARTVFNLTAAEGLSRRVGDIVECVHAREPGGCGRTVHCSGCALRRAVTDTAADGRPRDGVPAYQSVHTSRGVELTLFRISTQAVGNIVLATIGPAACASAGDAISAECGRS